MALETSPEPTSLVGQVSSGVVYGLGLLFVTGTALWQFLSQRAKKDEPKVLSTTIEMVDSATIARGQRELQDAFARGFREMMDRGDIRDERIVALGRQMEDAIERLRKIETMAEIERELRRAAPSG